MQYAFDLESPRWILLEKSEFKEFLLGDDENRKIVKFFPRLFLDKLEIEETDF